MRLGICTSVENAAAVKAAGWDFVEESVQNLLQGHIPDEQWNGAEKAEASPLPIVSANLLLPAEMKITGPHVDNKKLHEYMSTVLSRAGKIGIKTIVFGSAGARKIPAGWDRNAARMQILSFLDMAAPLATSQGVTIVVEHLQHGECNIINTVAEALGYVKEISQPNIACLVDTYHLWMEGESLDSVKAALPHIRHVHLADKDGRVAPGESGKADYRPFFHLLKEGGYNGPISVEASGFKDIAGIGPRVLAFVKKQWQEA